MYINNIYRNKILKYSLTDEEYNDIDKVWKFMKIFRKRFLLLADYRKDVISNIREKYTIDQFYYYESILNKLFWNIRWLLFPFWKNDNISKDEYKKIINNNYDNYKNLPDSVLLCKFYKYNTMSDLKYKLENKIRVLQNSNYYRSFINKLVIVDKKNKYLMVKPMSGSSHIFSKNYFNLLTIEILFDKKKYEKIMKNPYSIKYDKFIRKVMESHYYQLDYGFPNLNYCTYTFGTKEDRMNRIRKMYYDHDNIRKQARSWSILIN